MSFAFSSFTPVNPSAIGSATSGAGPNDKSNGGNGGGAPGSPTGSPRLRPASPHRYSGSFTAQSKLSPEQLVDLARASCNPRPAVPSPSLSAGSGNGNGGGSGGSFFNIHSGPASPALPTPVSFTPLPESIFLPFIDRPQEVTQLVSQPPTSKLLALLQQTFPADARAPWGSENARMTGDSDSKHWTFADFEYWLKRVDRDVADDQVWARKMRACLLSRSELLWERIKGALGVPPELDVDEDEEAEVGLVVEHADADADADARMVSSGAARMMVVPDAELLDESAVADSPLDMHHSYPYDRDHSEHHPEAYAEELDAYASEETTDEISIEPVLASSGPPPPPPPPAAELGSSLEEVREEDEEEVTPGTEIGEQKKKRNELAPPDEQVHGLRICTSSLIHPTAGMRSPFIASSAPGNCAGGVGVGSGASGSGSGSVQASPTLSMRRMHLGDGDGDSVYDIARERGPGHPLFPSSFANLALKPTLGAK